MILADVVTSLQIWLMLVKLFNWSAIKQGN